MRLNKIIVLLGLIGIGGSAQAASLGVLGGVGLSKFSENTSTKYKAKLGFGGGAYVGVMLHPMFEIDFGALYMQRKFQYDATNGTVVNKFNSLQFPVIARLNFMNMLSIGAGGYYAMAMGDIGVEATPTGGGTTTSTTMTYANSGYAKSDYGLVGSVALYFPVGPMTRFILDGRYLLGLKDVNKNPAVTDKWRDLQVLAGLAFGM